jgi:hypothetical protein
MAMRRPREHDGGPEREATMAVLVLASRGIPVGENERDVERSEATSERADSRFVGGPGHIAEMLLSIVAPGAGRLAATCPGVRRPGGFFAATSRSRGRAA